MAGIWTRRFAVSKVERFYGTGHPATRLIAVDPPKQDEMTVYLNVFRNYKTADMDAEAYAADAKRMETLARQQKGFIAFKRYMASDGEALSISEWETEEDARAWAHDAEHASVQARARSGYYESYVVYSCNDPKISRFQARQGRGFSDNSK